MKSSEKNVNEDKPKNFERSAFELVKELFTLGYFDAKSYSKKEDDKYITQWASYEVDQYQYLEIKLKTPLEVIDGSKNTTNRES